LSRSIRLITRRIPVLAFMQNSKHREWDVRGIRTARLMREQGISAVTKRRRVRTTDSRHTHPVAANLLDRNFTATEPNQKWVGDITGIPTAQGWLYLAVILDLYSRLVVGWSMSAQRDETLVECATSDGAFTSASPGGIITSHRSSKPIHQVPISRGPRTS
jgi:putative transposase